MRTLKWGYSIDILKTGMTIATVRTQHGDLTLPCISISDPDLPGVYLARVIEKKDKVIKCRFDPNVSREDVTIHVTHNDVVNYMPQS